GNCRCLRARDFFLHLLAFPSEDHDLTEKILLELSEMPVNRGSEMILDYLGHESTEIRAAAASALANTAPAKERVTAALIKVANNDPEEEVRVQALFSLKDRARLKDGEILTHIVKSAERSDCEKANALRAVVISASRCRDMQEGPMLYRLALDAIKQGLNRKRGDLALEAAQLAYLLGRDIEPLLLEILNDASFSPSVHEYIIESLGKLKCESALPLLTEFLKAFPNTRGDEAETEENPGKRLAQRAAEALARIDAQTLLNQTGSTAHNALADFALKNGLLVYKDHIVNDSEKDLSSLWDAQEDLKAIQTGTKKEVIKKKILFLSANQVGEGRLNLDRELREIDAALIRSKNRDYLDLIVKLAVQVNDFRQGLLDHEPYILHFSGHGSEKGLIVLDEIGVCPEILSNSELSGILKIFKEKVVCVVLSSCYSARLANMVVKHIPYVIGMKKEIPDNASIAFSAAFYDAIGAGRTIEDAFELGCLAFRPDDSSEGPCTASLPILKKRKTA
ncbi:MAG TPA: HEAT repeat domain-containing protein, partial [Candidatus Kapabacteria bacterium]|nr:HEAT repeat domain-containing protein [Candidatus Kapabacteria bacterium]